MTISLAPFSIFFYLFHNFSFLSFSLAKFGVLCYTKCKCFLVSTFAFTYHWSLTYGGKFFLCLQSYSPPFILYPLINRQLSNLAPVLVSLASLHLDTIYLFPTSIPLSFEFLIFLPTQFESNS